jgi:hypothetical protein
MTRDAPDDFASAALNESSGTAGARMFARYAYAPNKLGYCGPPEPGTLIGDGDVRTAARRFSGAWPYLQVLSRLTGIEDPLDHRIVESYWLGGGVGAQIPPRDVGLRLLAIIGPQAGGYWTHLTQDLLDEAAGNHCFHVFGVYPWSRLLGTGAPEPLQVLDSCRIRWGTVLSRDEDLIEVSSQRLTWDGTSLGLGEPTTEQVRVSVDGQSFLPDVAPGDQVALHWDWLTDRLRPDQVDTLAASTLDRLERTNRRLAKATW